MTNTYQKPTSPPTMSTLATADASPASLYAAGSATASREKRITRSARTASTAHITKQSTPSISSLTTDEEAKLLAAITLRVSLLTLLATGAAMRGQDNTGNIVIVLPRQQWQDDLRLK